MDKSTGQLDKELESLHQQAVGSETCEAERAAQLEAANQKLQDEIAGRKSEILARVRAEEALRQSEERYWRLLESVTDYVYTVEVKDRRSVATSHGPNCVAVTGYTAEEYAADPYLWHRMVYDEDKAAVMEQATRILAQAGAPPLEHRLVHKNGSIRWVRNTPVPHYDDQGRLVAYDGLIADITERKRAEEALRQSEERYRRLVETSPDVIVLVKVDGEILMCSQQAIFMFGSESVEELVGKNIFEFVSPQDQQRVREDMRQAIEDREIRTAQYSLSRQDGTCIPAEINASLIADAEGRPQAIISVIRDITERKRAEEARLREKEAAARAEVAEAAQRELEREIIERKQAEQALRESEERYRRLFEDSPISLWEEDFSQVKQYFDSLRASGITDSRAYFERHPEAVIHCARLVKVLDVNKATVALMGARNKGELLVELSKVLANEAIEVFREELATLAEGGQRFESEEVHRTVTGEERFITLRLSVAPGYANSLGKVLVSVLDVTERKRAEEALDRHAAQLALINDIGRKIAAALELDEVLRRAARLVQKSFDYHHVALFTVNRERGELVMRARAGDFVDLYPPDHRMKLGQGMVGWVGRHGEKLLANDVSAEPRYINFYPDVLPTRSELSVPILVGEERVGVLDVQSPQLNAFDQNDVTVMETLADQIAVAIQNARLYEAAQRELAERKQAEKALEAERRRLFALMEELPAWVYLQAPDHSIRFANRFFRERFGEPGEKLCHEVMFGRQEPCETCETFRVLDTKTPLEWEWSQSPDGRIYQLYAYPFTDVDGSPLVLELGVDITERKRIEEELERRNEELMARNAIATTIGQSLDLDHILNVTLDTLLAVINVDAGWIQLLDEDKGALSLAAHRGFSPAMAEEIQTIQLGDGLSGRVAQSGQPIVIDNAAQDPRLAMKGSHREGLRAFAAVPIKSKDNVLGVLGILTRSSHRPGSQEMQLLAAVGNQVGVAIENARLAAQASEIKVLREMDRLRSELIANVSHELRTPLGLIKVFCTTLLREDVSFDSETQREFLGDIKQETDKLEKIVDNLLDLSRIQSGRLNLDKYPTNISQLVGQVMKTMEIQLTPRHHFVYDFPSEPLEATVDAKRMEEVLRNLLGNAIKYSPGGGEITVCGRKDKRQLLIQVSDQGIGIPSGELEKVFERFYRIENDITQSVRGVGLGLAVCRGIVEAHGGRIWVESTPGMGSTFYFTLPIGAEE